MYSVVKAEKRIINIKIKTIPDLWMRGKNAEKYFMCPSISSENSFENAVRLRFSPTSNWEKIKCTVLESKFSEFTWNKLCAPNRVCSVVKRLRIFLFVHKFLWKSSHCVLCYHSFSNIQKRTTSPKLRKRALYVTCKAKKQRSKADMELTTKTK